MQSFCVEGETLLPVLQLVSCNGLELLVRKLVRWLNVSRIESDHKIANSHFKNYTYAHHMFTTDKFIQLLLSCVQTLYKFPES